MHGLRESNEDGRYPQLMIREIFNDVRVKSKHAELMPAHDTGKQLHHDDFVVEGEPFVVSVEQIIQFLGKSLRIIQ